MMLLFNNIYIFSQPMLFNDTYIFFLNQRKLFNNSYIFFLNQTMLLFLRRLRRRMEAHDINHFMQENGRIHYWQFIWLPWELICIHTSKKRENTSFPSILYELTISGSLKPPGPDTDEKLPLSLPQ